MVRRADVSAFLELFELAGDAQCEKDGLERMRALIEARPELLQWELNGRTPLLHACDDLNPRGVLRLLDCGADPKQRVPREFAKRMQAVAAKAAAAATANRPTSNADPILRTPFRRACAPCLVRP